ncbi:tagatose-bisphosphate aldolase [Senegalia sp. (in: firmicutes)]|uniref:tagatose-bisphosphate aldolase n=1 Tax=Senegalia sp. (in: firmicutes) TaxID=1924098 RepID=UPI003F94BDF2
MPNLTENKKKYMKKITTDEGIINALAIDQRGSLKKMLGKTGGNVEEIIKKFKKSVSKELTQYASAILLDPEYGWDAVETKDNRVGLLMAYEETGYDASEEGRLPDLLPNYSVKRLKEKEVDAIKILLYYDKDESDKINDQKKAFIERVGSECLGEDIPFFLEIVTYDKDIDDVKGKEYAKVKPQKVIEAMKDFSDERYNVDVLKVEVPVNMNFVEGYCNDEIVHSKEEASKYFKEQSDATNLPFIFLSAGVTIDLFKKTLILAGESGSKFNGVLCGRATWKDSVDVFTDQGEEQAQVWLQTTGKLNVVDLDTILKNHATPIDGLK